MAQYATGYVRPKNIDHFHRQSWARYGHFFANLPVATEAQWDCRKLGWVGPIKDQGNCGSCWCFAGTGCCEMAMVKAGVGPVDTFQLSEQYTLDCGRNGGCGGDDHSSVFEMAKSTGLPLTSDYGPYEANSGRCKIPSKTFKITDWGYCAEDEELDTQAIKNAMVKYGPISVAIAADGDFMNVRPGEVFDGNDRGINHEVILVGWDDSKSAWILRNSWGDWCDNGYCLIKYGANSVGTSAAWTVVPEEDIHWDI